MPNNTVVFLLACHFTCWSFADEKWGFKRQSQQFTNKRSTRVALKPPNKVWKKKKHISSKTECGGPPAKLRMCAILTTKSRDSCHQKLDFNLPMSQFHQPLAMPEPPKPLAHLSSLLRPGEWRNAFGFH
jgi:hypothetical protein